MKKKIVTFGFMMLLTAVFCISTVFAQESQSRIVEEGGTGKYPAIMKTENSLPTHTIFVPQDISVFGKKNKLPIIAWGNGACFNSPWEHYKFLNEIASHGFIVVAIGLMPQESGEPVRGRSESKQMIDAIDWAIAQNGDKKSPYYKKLDIDNIAISGMSCGGLQTLANVADPRVSTVVICNSGLFKDPSTGVPGMPQPGKDQLKKIHTPVLYLLGGKLDIAYENGMDDYNRIDHVPAFVANLEVGHGGTYAQPHGGEFARVATAWFQWQLKGDDESGKLFMGNPCGLSQAEGWTVDKKKIP